MFITNSIKRIHLLNVLIGAGMLAPCLGFYLLFYQYQQLIEGVQLLMSFFCIAGFAALASLNRHFKAENLRINSINRKVVQEKADLEIILDTAAQHSEIIEKMLQNKAENIKQDKADLEIMLETNVQHADSITADLKEKAGDLEIMLETNVQHADSITADLKEKAGDLEIMLDTNVQHADSITADLKEKAEEAEEAVRETEKRLAQFLEALPIGVVVMNTIDKPPYINQMGLQILGKSMQPEVSAEQLAEYYQLCQTETGQLYASDRLPVVRALKGECVTISDIEVRRPDKSIPLEVQAIPIFDGEGKVAYAIAAFQDITCRKQAEAERSDFIRKLQAKNIVLEQMEKASTRFVPHEFLKSLGHRSLMEVKLGDQVQAEMSIMFSDIRAFTDLSESMSPRQNFNFINAYLRRIAPVIRGNNGFIDKYIGDAVMALFPKTADDAVQAAIAVQQQIEQYNRQRRNKGYVPIATGIGLHIGKLILGTVGESHRMETTVIADAVNLSARLEGLTKRYGACIIISGSIMERMKKPEEHRFLDRVRVKGKAEPLDIWEIYAGDPPPVAELKRKTKDNFEQGIHFYRTRQFSDAQRIFREVLRINGQDKAAVLYERRCADLLKSGVSEEWNGIATWREK
ncbi:MAG: PAS domain S-box protein [Gammaproteobacteria bacterium]|nr:PAS domain S-box protein [Gammaproteobacteria bacterium]